jgi:hypothetical protein
MGVGRRCGGVLLRQRLGKGRSRLKDGSRILRVRMLFMVSLERWIGLIRWGECGGK